MSMTPEQRRAYNRQWASNPEGKTCDCGQPAYRRDGSGWFCKDCEAAVNRIQKWLHDYITRERVEDAWLDKPAPNALAEYQRLWRSNRKSDRRKVTL